MLSSVSKLKLMSLCAALLAVPLACGKIQGNLRMGDPELGEFKSMFSVDRASLGIAPLSSGEEIRIEKLSPNQASQSGYDALLHFKDAYSREMIFEKKGAGYNWCGEKVTYFGPGVYNTADVYNEKERLIVRYSTRPAWTAKSEGLSVRYSGPDRKVDAIVDWTPEKIEELIKKWGYKLK